MMHARRPVDAVHARTSSPRSLLYALSAADMTMLLALVFVLARNIIKLVVERRRGLPFSRFRAKLVLAMLGLTIIPSVLVLLVGGELIRQTTARWFAAPVEEVLRSATGDRRRLLRRAPDGRAGPCRTHCAPALRRRAAVGRRRVDCGAAIEGDVRQGRVGLVEVYRVRSNGPPTPVVAVESPSLPERARTGVGGPARGADRHRHRRQHRARSARRAAASWFAPASSFRTHRQERPIGVVIASDYLGGIARAELTPDHRRLRGLQPLLVLKPALEGVYLSVFLMMTLMILVSATWMGLYLAKRITRPVQLLAAGAREIGAGRLDHRIEPETRDEFGSLVEAFNTMAGELAASQQQARTVAAGPRAEERRSRGAPPLLRNDPRADRDRCRVDHRGPADRDGQCRGGSAARA